MKKLGLALALVMVLGTVLSASCGGGAPAPTVTVTKTAPPVTVTVTSAPGAVATATVTQTAPAATVTVTAAPATPKLVKVRVSDAAGGAGQFFRTVGMEQGMFANRGIELIPQLMTVAAARIAPFVGQAEISPGDILPFAAERQDVRFIGAYYGLHQGLVVRKDSPYRSYQDLKGKKIGILGPATGQYQAVKVITKLLGMDLEKDFILTTGEATVQIGWLLKGEVEAATLFEPHISKLLTSDGDKVRELFWLNDLFKNLTGSSWLYGGVYTTDDWAKKNPELARMAGLAYGDTLRYVWAHNGVWKSETAKKAWETDDSNVLELLVQRMSRIVEVPPYGPTYKAALVKKAQLMADVGILPAGVTVDWYSKIFLFAD